MAEMIALDSIAVSSNATGDAGHAQQVDVKVKHDAKRKNKYKVFQSSVDTVAVKDISPHVQDLLIQLNNLLVNLNSLVDDLMSPTMSTNEGKFYDASVQRIKSVGKLLSRVTRQVDNMRIYLSLKSKERVAKAEAERRRRHSLHDLTDNRITLTCYTRTHSVTGDTAVAAVSHDHTDRVNATAVQVNSDEHTTARPSSDLEKKSDTRVSPNGVINGEPSETTRPQYSSVITLSNGCLHRSVMKKAPATERHVSADCSRCYKCNILIISLIILSGVTFVLLRILLEWSNARDE